MIETKYATLDAEELAKLKSLEVELESLVLALEPAVELADLSSAQLALLQSLEKELGVVLLAYKPAA